MTNNINRFPRYSFMLGLILFLLSCHDDEKKCDCRGEPTLRFADDFGVVLNSPEGYLIVTGRGGISKICDIGEQQTNQRIIFEGEIRSNCYISTNTEVELSNIIIKSYHVVSKMDSVIDMGGIKLNIIHSEDYGHEQGFGFLLSGLATEWLVPYNTVTGEVFQNREDALRVGILTVSKMRRVTKYPDMTRDELKLLGIIK